MSERYPKIRVGILGATGMVGQRLITLLQEHPWFEITLLAASSRSAGKSYGEVMQNRWRMEEDIPPSIRKWIIKDVADIADNAKIVDVVFCALDMTKEAIQKLEEDYATADVAVVSCNSAHRWVDDVPMIIPEVNADHLALIDFQRKKRGWKKGCVVVKPNCSVQSYVPVLQALKKFEPEKIFVTTLQAISGSGKTLKDSPFIHDNVMPLEGEENKSEKEPLKILGTIRNGCIQPADLKISAHCNRVPTEDGHLALLSVSFKKKPTKEEILSCWKNQSSMIEALHLPSAPSPYLQYLEEEDRPQTRLDRDFQKGMGISIGRLRECPLLDYRFTCLSHNTLRGAAGGAVLTAELMVKKGWIEKC